MTMDPSLPGNDSSNPAEATTFCYRHPTVESALRCNVCGKVICARCARRTPVGYRCPDCLHQQQNAFFNAGQTDYVIAGVTAFVCAIPTVYLLTTLGLFFIIFLGIPAGGLISEIVHRVLRKRRGRYTWAVVAGAVVAGGLAANIQLVPILLRGNSAAVALLLLPAIVTGLVAATAAARFRYGK